MATTSICGPVAAAVAGSPVRARLLTHDLTGGAAPTVDERMLQELRTLAGSDGSRRRRQRHQRRRAARHSGLRLFDGLRVDPDGSRVDPGSDALPDPAHLQGPMESVLQGPMETVPRAMAWLGDLDSNQDCSVQSREFYR